MNMNMPDEPPPPSDPPPKAGLTLANSKDKGRARGRDLEAGATALRRRRLQIVRYLQIIACLREEASELRAEISSLESIIGAQADAISAMRRNQDDPED
ncbi:hypothetical protein [Pusillimonas noertemannii]|uniref:Uncharacterized protein n=1 Tax=Pusillimonas noertemannii TaxID=305977 RepID=A0A2U1CSC8_9BURK|nr:hypothetical protein [Pusillimonas noertemannii]NYT68133.1 hypothetical protein [Pusillimonas noertemannii]PVY68810.1 hypothetical protein C7440_1221 [Pusillimonas noertemannii]TFL11736.1 hypothetical protein CSC72_00980 [Pusillimonas noertemannii]